MELRQVQAAIIVFTALFAQEIIANNEKEKDNGGTIWAVLVAGSNGWYNYRHQADVCHAYQTLINHGVNPEHIITMMYDDIANHWKNEYPGKIFNSPLMKDVYNGVRIDYKGAEVSPENFMAILRGDSEAVDGKRVLQSTENDKVFIFFSDHGGVGLIAFPYDERMEQHQILTVKELTETLQKMNEQKMYKELTFYLEACESGSMFHQKTAQNMNIYAVTAANGREYSWAAYCDLNITGLSNNCLGDLFSVNWMEDSDKHLNLHDETLAKQFNVVKRNTKLSHVKWFGNIRMMAERVSEFQGKTVYRGDNVENVAEEQKFSPQNFAMYPSRDIALVAEKTEEGRKALLKKRDYLDKEMDRFVQIAEQKLMRKENKQNGPKISLKSDYPTQIMQTECHHTVVHAFNKYCFNFAKNPYALKYTNILANLCENGNGNDTEQIVRILREHCANIKNDEEIH